jgi:cytochrome P450
MAVNPGEAMELDFDWLAPGALGPDYVPRLRRLQKHAAVFWSERQHAWIVTRYRDIAEGLKDSRLSSYRFHLALERHTRERGWPEGALLRSMRHWMFNLDGREHMRLRTLLLKPFAKGEIEHHRERTRAVFANALERVRGRPSFEFQKELAFPYVAQVLLELLGLSECFSPQEITSLNIAGAMTEAIDDAKIAAADQAVERVGHVLGSEMEKRRRAPRGDLLTSLVSVADQGDRLSDFDITGIFLILALGGIDTTSYTLAMMMPVLERSPGHRDYIRAHPGRITPIVEELQRLVVMKNMVHRLATQDFDWHGEQIRKGDMVFLMLGIGNWDESVFPHPDTLDFERQRTASLIFAPGLHHCIGHNVAKMELEVALGELLARFDRVEVLDEHHEFHPNTYNRGFKALNARLVDRVPA